MGKSTVDAKKLLKDYINFHKGKCSKIGDKGNQVLYDLCKKYPSHTDENKIRAKIWLIGRAYSAAIERRKPNHKYSKLSNDAFYSKVTRKIAASDLDQQIKKIRKNIKLLNEANIKIICDAHHYLTDKFKFLTGLDKRSLASKYLHFHRPLVPIYDSRAKKSITRIFRENSCLKECERKLSIKKSNSDKEYQSFVEKIISFQSFLSKEGCKKCTMRDIDKYLILKAG